MTSSGSPQPSCLPTSQLRASWSSLQHPSHPQPPDSLSQQDDARAAPQGLLSEKPLLSLPRTSVPKPAPTAPCRHWVHHSGFSHLSESVQLPRASDSKINFQPPPHCANCSITRVYPLLPSIQPPLLTPEHLHTALPGRAALPAGLQPGCEVPQPPPCAAVMILLHCCPSQEAIFH